MIPCFRVLPVNSGFGYGTGPDIADCEAWQCLKEYRTGNCHSDAKLSSELVTTKMSLSFLLFLQDRKKGGKGLNSDLQNLAHVLNKIQTLQLGT